MGIIRITPKTTAVIGGCTLNHRGTVVDAMASTTVPLWLSVQPPMTAVVFGVIRIIPIALIDQAEPCLHPLIHTNQAI